MEKSMVQSIFWFGMTQNKQLVTIEYVQRRIPNVSVTHSRNKCHHTRFWRPIPHRIYNMSMELPCVKTKNNCVCCIQSSTWRDDIRKYDCFFFCSTFSSHNFYTLRTMFCLIYTLVPKYIALFLFSTLMSKVLVI